MRAEEHAVELICRVLREQGCQIVARTYRSWKRAGRVVAAGTVSDAYVAHGVGEITWTIKVDADGVLVRRLSREELYGRRKTTAYVRRRDARGVRRRGGPGDANAGSVRGQRDKGTGPRSRPHQEGTGSGPGTLVGLAGAVRPVRDDPVDQRCDSVLVDGVSR